MSIYRNNKLFILLYVIISFTTNIYASALKTISTETINSEHSPVKLKSDNNLLSLNHATAKQIAKSFKGFGIKRSNAIVNFREQHGNFKIFDDLSKVGGITKNYINKNRKRLEQTFSLDA